MPNSLLEALASGVPVVSTDVGGIPYVVRHGETALLVPAGDHEAMADAVLQVLRDSELAARLRASGLQAAKNYAWPRVREGLFDAYARALGMPSRAVLTP
jgi:glycosyltransferase involved in cell wall biosynthesis